MIALIVDTIDQDGRIVYLDQPLKIVMLCYVGQHDICTIHKCLCTTVVRIRVLAALVYWLFLRSQQQHIHATYVGSRDQRLYMIPLLTSIRTF